MTTIDHLCLEAQEAEQNAMESMAKTARIRKVLDQKELDLIHGVDTALFEEPAPQEEVPTMSSDSFPLLTFSCWLSSSSVSGTPAAVSCNDSGSG